MIVVVTGQPGAGKTLYTLHMVQEWAAREGREVYFSGIKDLRLPWIELPDGAEWHKLPAKSIVVIDEAQRVFRPRGTGAQVPLHVAELETHRHKGVDLVLVTQHPKLLDVNVRRLVGRHLHVVRTFGLQRATVHEWAEVQGEVESASGRSDSIRHEWGYPKELFAAYQSAEVHTHKRRVPARVWLLLLVPLLIGGLVWGMVSWVSARIEGAKGKRAGPTEAGEVQPGRKAGKGPELERAQYFDAHAPRVAGLAHTAPVYDPVTSPVRAPYPAACVASKSRCQCYSEQGTRLDMPAELCRSIVDKGFYVAWDATARPLDGGKAVVVRPEVAERTLEPVKADAVRMAPMPSSVGPESRSSWAVR